MVEHEVTIRSFWGGYAGMIEVGTMSVGNGVYILEKGCQSRGTVWRFGLVEGRDLRW